MQKNSQNDTLFSSLFYIRSRLPSLRWMKITGACIIIARNAQYEIKPKGTDTRYSWAMAEMKNTIKLAPSLETPTYNSGL